MLGNHRCHLVLTSQYLICSIKPHVLKSKVFFDQID